MSETRNPRFKRALQRMEATHDAKSHDYATDDNPYSNFDFAATVAERFGEPHDHVFATMVGIKLARLGELLGRGKTPKHESIDDTFLDLANYVVLWWTSRERLADNPARNERVATPLTRFQLEAQAARQPLLDLKTSNDYISDGLFGLWLRCGPTCDLRMTCPGKVTCKCHGPSDDTA